MADELTQEWNVPSYMSSAATHSVANLNESWSDELTFTEKAGYLVKSAALSGINGFYNTAVWAGNLFSDEEAVYRDTRDYVSEFDDDTAKYYDENRQTADLVGFVISSFIPGLGGVKVLNAGAKVLAAANEGRVGINMANALGLIPGARDALVKTAVAEAATTSRAYSMANAATGRAVVAGFGEQAIQALAFETAVAATMHKNPILDQMDTGDLIKNIFMGAALGGAIGGVLNTATTAMQIKGAIKNVDKLTADVTQLKRGAPGVGASDDILIVRGDLENTRINTKEGVSQEHWDELVERKYQQAENAIRNNVSTLTGGDEVAARVIYEGIANDSTAVLSAKMLGLQEIAPTSQLSNLGKKYGLIDEAAEGLPKTHAVRYIRAWGEDMGAMTDDLPASYLSDSLKPGQRIEIVGNKVKVGNDTYAMNPRENFSPSLTKAKEAMARVQWAYDTSVPKLALKEGETLLTVGHNDIATLTKAYREGFTDLRVVNTSGELMGEVTSREYLLATLRAAKERVNQELIEKSFKSGKLTEADSELISFVTDTPLGTLTGTGALANVEDSLFLLKQVQQKYWNKVHANTPNPPAVESLEPWKHNRNFAMVYDLERVQPVDNFLVEGTVAALQKSKLQQLSNELAVTRAMGEDASLLPSMNEKVIKQFDRTGAGPGFISYANGGYGSAQSFFEFVGKWTNNQKIKATETISHTFNNVAQKLKQSPNETAELAAIMQKVRNSGQHYVLTDEGSELILRQVRDSEIAISSGRQVDDIVLPPGIEETIKINSPNVRKFIKTHIDVNAERLNKSNTMRHAQGMYDDFDSKTFYPPQPNPDRFTHHAFVVDDVKVTSDHNTSMLYADSAANLEKQIAEARAQGFRVYTKGEAENYYRARGAYDYSKGLNENLIDSRLRRGGTSAPTFPLTGSPEEMVDDILSWHIKKEHGLIRDAVELKYANEFGVLRQMGEQYTQIATSTRTPSLFGKREAKNPFQEYIDLALDKPHNSKYPLWDTMNQAITKATDRVFATASNVVREARTPYDLDEVNKIFERYGLNVAATPAQMEAWVNHPAGRGALTKFVRTQNSMLSTLILRLDPINALNNALGSNVLLGAETSAVLRAMERADEKAVGELAGLMRIQVPGVSDTIQGPGKLIANAYSNFFKNHDELVKKYSGLGIDVNLSKQFKLMIDDLTLTGTETAAELQTRTQRAFTKLKEFGDVGERYTGNKLAESMNRYVTANVMDQITSRAVAAGVMDQKIANTYINTFVNRVQGNLLANQRPQIFTGPVGQAIGLFQSYQFNIMQQLLRHVGEGSRKDALTLLGLQGTLYGMNGLPAFQAINNHIIGTASGNVNHTDAYSSVYNAAGKTAGDWLMYGMASNMMIHPDLKVNLYSRGDISPRSLTVVPTTLAEVPVVGAYSKLFGSLKESLGTVDRGGDIWNTFLSGIEQGSVNRPLAGLAKVVRGVESGVSFSASAKGNIVSANDFYSLANLARLSGAKPFDEAVAQDAAFRVQAYSRKDAAERASLGKAIKSVVVGGGHPTSEQLETFQEEYVKTGGKQEEFNKWFVNQVKKANVPQANQIIEKQKNSMASQYMSAVMGGRVYRTPTEIIESQNASLE